MVGGHRQRAGVRVRAQRRVQRRGEAGLVAGAIAAAAVATAAVLVARAQHLIVALRPVMMLALAGQGFVICLGNAERERETKNHKC